MFRQRMKLMMVVVSAGLLPLVVLAIAQTQAPPAGVAPGEPDAVAPQHMRGQAMTQPDGRDQMRCPMCRMYRSNQRLMEDLNRMVDEAEQSGRQENATQTLAKLGEIRERLMAHKEMMQRGRRGREGMMCKCQGEPGHPACPICGRCPMCGKMMDEAATQPGMMGGPMMNRGAMGGGTMGRGMMGGGTMGGRMRGGMQEGMMGAGANVDPAAQSGMVVNEYCPIMTANKLDRANVPANLTRMFQGQKVGFCCGACPPQWDKLSDAQKQAKLAAVMPK